jgi:hypothetical protein
MTACSIITFPCEKVMLQTGQSARMLTWLFQLQYYTILTRTLNAECNILYMGYIRAYQWLHRKHAILQTNVPCKKLSISALWIVFLSCSTFFDVLNLAMCMLASNCFSDKCLPYATPYWLTANWKRHCMNTFVCSKTCMAWTARLR